jgi:hypothetical protein
MRIKITFLFLGALLGAIIAAIVGHREYVSSQEILHMQRDAMIEATIDAIDTLEEGENVAAQLMLASAVNAQAQIVSRQPDASAEDLSKAREWQSRMQGHNARLNLRSGAE